MNNTPIGEPPHFVWPFNVDIALAAMAKMERDECYDCLSFTLYELEEDGLCIAARARHRVGPRPPFALRADLEQIDMAERALRRFRDATYGQPVF